MLFVMALFVWFVLSVPAALVVGRMLGAGTRNSDRPVRTPSVATSGHRLITR
jgi:hypothetical protein